MSTEPDWELDDEDPESVGLPVFDGEHVHVLREMCATCIFRPGNLMRLPPGRVAGMVKDSIAAEAAITCHSTLYADTQQAVCRGYFDRHANSVLTLRLAQIHKIIRFIDQPTKEH